MNETKYNEIEMFILEKCNFSVSWTCMLFVTIIIQISLYMECFSRYRLLSIVLSTMRHAIEIQNLN